MCLDQRLSDDSSRSDFMRQVQQIAMEEAGDHELILSGALNEPATIAVI
jgi:hypothetical protein